MNGVSGRTYTTANPMRGIMTETTETENGFKFSMPLAIASVVMISAFMRR